MASKSPENQTKDELKNESKGKSSSSDPQNIESDSISNKSRNSSEDSILTIESLKYLQIVDHFVSGKHWQFDKEYHLNAISAVLWSLFITYFVFCEITANCSQQMYGLLAMSVLLSAITAIELMVVSIVWYLSLIYGYINKSKICLAVICMHLIIASLNLLMAIIDFGSNTCYLRLELEPSVTHLVQVKYEIKFMGLFHCIVAINLFVCAMLLAIKRNDFKFYVLWRKGLLNEYLLLDDE